MKGHLNNYRGQVQPTFFGAIPDRYMGLPSAHDITGSGWSSPNSTRATTSNLAPDGVSFAQKLVEDTTNNPHFLSQFTQVFWGVKQRMAIFAKADGRTRLQLDADDRGFVVNGVTVTFDLANGTVAIPGATYGTGWSFVDASITPFANGWYRCYLDFTSPIGASGQYMAFLDAGSGAAAQNRTYAGDGTSGVLIWITNQLPASAWSIANRTFFDDFNDIRTIDTADTRAAGFNWYTHAVWPNAHVSDQVAANLFWSTFSPTPAGGISIANSILTLDGTLFQPAPPGEGGSLSAVGALALSSAATDGGSGFVGRNFTYPAVIEAKLSVVAGAFPIYWSAATEFLTGQTGTYTEPDYGEWGGTSMGLNIHGYNQNGVPFAHIQQPSASSLPFITPPGGPTKFADMHLYSTLWTTQASNGGNGLVMTFMDYQFVDAVLYGPTITLVGTLGAFTDSDAHHFMLMIGMETPDPTYWDYVAIYQ